MMEMIDSLLAVALAGWAIFAIYRAGVRKGRSEVEDKLRLAENTEVGSGFIAMHAVSVANGEMTVQQAHAELQGWEAIGVLQGVAKAWKQLAHADIIALGQHAQNDPDTRAKIEAFMRKVDQIELSRDKQRVAAGSEIK